MVGTVKALIQQAANAAQASGNPELAELLDRIANEEPLIFITGGVAVLPKDIPEWIVRDYDNEEVDGETDDSE